MSTTTSSGSCFRTSAMSCDASPHCPATAKPECSSRLARPARKRTSSSASATRIRVSVTLTIIGRQQAHAYSRRGLTCLSLPGGRVSCWRPVEQGPDRAADRARRSAPVGGQGGDDDESPTAIQAGSRLGPGSPVIVDSNTYMIAPADLDAKGEPAAGPSRAAVLDGVSGEFGGAQNDLVGGRAAVEHAREFTAHEAYLVYAAGIAGGVEVSAGCNGAADRHRLLRSQGRYQEGGVLLAPRGASDPPGHVAAASSDPAFMVFDEQVRSRVALRKLAADRPVGGLCVAPRRDARMVQLLARPVIDAYRTVRVIEPCRVHGAPPAAWVDRSRIGAM